MVQVIVHKQIQTKLRYRKQAATDLRSNTLKFNFQLVCLNVVSKVLHGSEKFKLYKLVIYEIAIFGI